MTNEQIFQAYFRSQPYLHQISYAQSNQWLYFLSNGSNGLSDKSALQCLDLFSPLLITNSASLQFLNGDIQLPITDPSKLINCDNMNEEPGLAELIYNPNFFCAALRGDPDALWKFLGFEISEFGTICLDFVWNSLEALALLTYSKKHPTNPLSNENCANAAITTENFQALIRFGDNYAYILESNYSSFHKDHSSITITEIINCQKTRRFRTITKLDEEITWEITFYAPCYSASANCELYNSA